MGGHVRISRWVIAAAVAALAATLVAGAAFGGSKQPAAQKAGYKAGLVGDVGTFNDNGFNKNQVLGIKAAAKAIHGKAYTYDSHGSNDYQPNFQHAVADGNKLIIAAGFLLGDTVKAFAQQYPNIKFAITDDPVAAIGGFKNEEGITYAAEQAGCLVGVLAAKQAKSMGKKKIGVVAGIKLPSVDSWIAGYQFCAKKAVKGTKTLIQYSNSFIDQAACSNLAQNEIGSGAQVIFQVAGLCGDGALKEASKLGKWGIGVDTDEYKVAKRILTSGIKKTYTGVYNTVVSASKGHFKGGKNLVFNLKNNGVGVGKITPQITKKHPAWVKLMKQFKSKIIHHKLKVPAVLP
jgi:basic membrane protein A and related proteins